MRDHDRNLLEPLPVESARRIEAELAEGEHLIWVGQPRADLYSRGWIIPVIFGIFFVAFAALWMAIPLVTGLFISGVGAAKEGAGGGICGMPFFCFSLFGLPFLVVGGYIISTPIRAGNFARKSAYALTDRRAITFQAGSWNTMTVRSYEPTMLNNIIRVENPDGSGSLIFQESLVGWGRRTSTRRYGFLCIDNIAHVEDLIRKHLLRRE